jgi:AcrR family transcriptional regulator
MRSDASRNHETILTSAIAVFARSPQASMREIARASGTGRTTLYRHFPDRDALIAAIYERVLGEADEITVRALSAEDATDPEQVVAGLAVELAGLGDRYRFLEQHLPRRPTTEAEQALERGTPLLDYIEAAQRRGRIRGDLDAAWLFEVLVALITQAATHAHHHPEARSAMLRATIISILMPTAETSRRT